MDIILSPTKFKSAEVLNFDEIKTDAHGMLDLLDKGIYRGDRKVSAVAISHAQVSGHPKKFFVISRAFRELFGGRRIIVNAEIVIARYPTKFREACLSFPEKGEVETKRYQEIEVKYQYPSATGELHHPVSRVVTGIAAFIFQHEIDHADGLNIHDKFHGTIPTSGTDSTEEPA